ncbi:hypothetical protein B0H14DRAFT_2824288 [Mycena olivaceomarginata]|nr:hypothetical protein B0H14DRAFT_2824288 [Mycena olivaceomarginata]
MPALLSFVPLFLSSLLSPSAPSHPHTLSRTRCPCPPRTRCRRPRTSLPVSLLSSLPFLPPRPPYLHPLSPPHLHPTPPPTTVYRIVC